MKIKKCKSAEVDLEMCSYFIKDVMSEKVLSNIINKYDEDNNYFDGNKIKNIKELIKENS